MNSDDGDRRRRRTTRRHFARGLVRGAAMGAALSVLLLGAVVLVVQWPASDSVRAASAD